jgi:hypothetical protein
VRIRSLEKLLRVMTTPRVRNIIKTADTTVKNYFPALRQRRVTAATGALSLHIWKRGL